ncbi:hypothetical protein [Usitatibacter palustris]|uniref:hypothetical protein n=1 Tax=Usitatibacter palustris TaxID=2732487 RepID=UPI0014889BC1|nr:hypothetical protein [Usitatibacter palustris]
MKELPQEPDEGDRRLGALIGVLTVIGTALLPALVLFIVTLDLRGHWHLWNYFEAVHIWGPILALAAAVLGYRLGTSRAAEFAGHLWFTERPWNAWLSAKLWAVFLATASITTLLY